MYEYPLIIIALYVFQYRLNKQCGCSRKDEDRQNIWQLFSGPVIDEPGGKIYIGDAYHNRTDDLQRQYPVNAELETDTQNDDKQQFFDDFRIERQIRPYFNH